MGGVSAAHLVLAGTVVLTLAGCGDDSPNWLLSLSAPRATVSGDTLLLTDPDNWAVGVSHHPQRMGAVISTQRLVTEWDALLGDEPVPAEVGGAQVEVSDPRVTDQGLEFTIAGSLPEQLNTVSVVVHYDRALKYSFDMTSAAGWTYTVTFEAGRRDQGTYSVNQPSATTVAFAGQRSRSLVTSDVVDTLAGRAYLILLDNRDYTVVPVTLRDAELTDGLLVLATDNSAPPAMFNRGTLFVDGLPTPA